MLSRVRSWSRQYAFWVPCSCELKVIYEIPPPVNLAGRDIDCTEWNRQKNNFFFKRRHNTNMLRAGKRHLNSNPPLQKHVLYTLTYM